MKAPVVKNKDYKDPYAHRAPNPARNMAGKGAPVSTTFGVLGETKMEPESRSLGGLVKSTKDVAAIQPGTVIHDTKGMNTEKGTIGPAAKTHVPGAHYAQVPYAGQYMTKVGHALS